MEDKQLIESKDSFISKVKKFFKNLFWKNKQKNFYHQETTNISNKTIDNIKEDKFLNDIKVDNSIIDKEIKRKDFLKEIEGNREVLNQLTNDRLIKLIEYYNGIIEENNRTIEKLKKI